MKQVTLVLFIVVVIVRTNSTNDCPANKSVLLLLGTKSEGVESAAISAADDAFSSLPCHLILLNKVCTRPFRMQCMLFG